MDKHIVDGQAQHRAQTIIVQFESLCHQPVGPSTRWNICFAWSLFFHNIVFITVIFDCTIDVYGRCKLMHFRKHVSQQIICVRQLCGMHWGFTFHRKEWFCLANSMYCEHIFLHKVCVCVDAPHGLPAGARCCRLEFWAGRGGGVCHACTSVLNRFSCWDVDLSKEI